VSLLECGRNSGKLTFPHFLGVNHERFWCSDPNIVAMADIANEGCKVSSSELADGDRLWYIEVGESRARLAIIVVVVFVIIFVVVIVFIVTSSLRVRLSWRRRQIRRLYHPSQFE
jgi:hypothetical protein